MTRRLNIGGTEAAEGWEVFNALPGDFVDHQGNASDLSRFDGNSFDAIYASHIVEHFDYKNELPATLSEWFRVLAPGGKIYISVPDMDTLCRYFIDPSLKENERFLVMMMMFGGHVDKYDYHYIGLNQQFLTGYLQAAGFVDITRVDDLGFFDDTSRLKFREEWVSLNMIAVKPVSVNTQTEHLPKVGRNQACPCGSGKKFKHCHGKRG